METAIQLMECYRLSRAEGLLAVEQKAERGDLHSFLQFCIKKIFEFYRKEIPQGKIEKMLYNYCKGEDSRENAEMIENALSGASGKVCKKFLSNISDKLLYFIDNDIKNCNADESEVMEAQKEILQMMVVLDIIRV